MKHIKNYKIFENKKKPKEEVVLKLNRCAKSFMDYHNEFNRAGKGTVSVDFTWGDFKMDEVMIVLQNLTPESSDYEIMAICHEALKIEKAYNQYYFDFVSNFTRYLNRLDSGELSFEISKFSHFVLVRTVTYLMEDFCNLKFPEPRDFTKSDKSIIEDLILSELEITPDNFHLTRKDNFIIISMSSRYRTVDMNELVWRLSEYFKGAFLLVDHMSRARIALPFLIYKDVE